MYDGIAEYLVLIAVVSVIVHLLIQRYAVAGCTSAALGSIGMMVYQAWIADFRVKPGWVAPLLLAGFVIALPASFICGLPHYFWRRYRSEREGLKPLESDTFEIL